MIWRFSHLWIILLSHILLKRLYFGVFLTKLLSKTFSMFAESFNNFERSCCTLNHLSTISWNFTISWEVSRFGDIQFAPLLITVFDIFSNDRLVAIMIHDFSVEHKKILSTFYQCPLLLMVLACDLWKSRNY